MKNHPDLPQYLRIADELRVKLRKLPLGAPFETEHALTEAYGVSRGTIRQALNVLEQEGLLVRSQGRGSFRSQPNVPPYRAHLSEDVASHIRRIGTTSGISDLSITLVRAPSEITDPLEIPRGTKVRKVSRVRTIDGVPSVYCVGYLRADLVPPFFKRDFKSSLSDLVQNTLQIHLSSRSCECLAVKADETVAAALSIPQGTAVLELRFFCRTYRDQPLLLDVLYFTPAQSLQFELITP